MRSQHASENSTDERGTPSRLIRTLQEGIGGKFSLDPCSGAEPFPIADTQFTIDDNGLAKSWAGHNTVYVNPPYSELLPWMRKIDREFERDHPGSPDLILALVPGNTSTKWFQNYGAKADYLLAFDSRLRFHGGDDNDPRFSSLLLVYGNPPHRLKNVLSSEGELFEMTRIQLSDERITQQRLESLTQSTPERKVLGDASQRLTPSSVDLGELGVYEQLHVSFDESTPGYPTSIPSEMDVHVVNGKPATSSDPASSEHWDAILAVDPETETYIELYQEPDERSKPDASMDLGSGWRDVTLESVESVASTSLTVLEPYGPGTAYVC